MIDAERAREDIPELEWRPRANPRRLLYGTLRANDGGCVVVVVIDPDGEVTVASLDEFGVATFRRHGSYTADLEEIKREARETAKRVRELIAEAKKREIVEEAKI